MTSPLVRGPEPAHPPTVSARVSTPRPFTCKSELNELEASFQLSPKARRAARRRALLAPLTPSHRRPRAHPRSRPLGPGRSSTRRRRGRGRQQNAAAENGRGFLAPGFDEPYPNLDVFWLRSEEYGGLAKEITAAKLERAGFRRITQDAKLADNYREIATNIATASLALAQFAKTLYDTSDVGVGQLEPLGAELGCGLARGRSDSVPAWFRASRTWAFWVLRLGPGVDPDCEHRRELRANANVGRSRVDGGNYRPEIRHFWHAARNGLP